MGACWTSIKAYQKKWPSSVRKIFEKLVALKTKLETRLAVFDLIENFQIHLTSIQILAWKEFGLQSAAKGWWMRSKENALP
jgi:hypothetical protein